jgi:glutamyl-tRNA reductase
VLPTITALRASATAIADGVLAENAGKWETASPGDRARAEAIARTVVNRLLHEPTLRMKETRDERLHSRMAVVRDLFGLSVADGELAGAGAGAAPAPAAHRDSGLAEVHPLRRPA